VLTLSFNSSNRIKNEFINLSDDVCLTIEYLMNVIKMTKELHGWYILNFTSLLISLQFNNISSLILSSEFLSLYFETISNFLNHPYYINTISSIDLNNIYAGFIHMLKYLNSSEFRSCLKKEVERVNLIDLFVSLSNSSDPSICVYSMMILLVIDFNSEFSFKENFIRKLFELSSVVDSTDQQDISKFLNFYL
jgi:hypothetical protein